MNAMCNVATCDDASFADVRALASSVFAGFVPSGVIPSPWAALYTSPVTNLDRDAGLRRASRRQQACGHAKRVRPILPRRSRGGIARGTLDAARGPRAAAGRAALQRNTPRGSAPVTHFAEAASR